MAVPAHDQRDLDFARAFDLPVRVVVDTGEPDPAVTGVATVGDGVLVNSGEYDGLVKAAAIERITADLTARGGGQAAVNYRLRDWLLSRQRYWGCPIPIVHCPTCGEVPVAEYTGGVEHAILHLLYSRFFTKVLYDMGLVGVVEPFAALLNQGFVIMNGSKMSKSKGNRVDLQAELARYGVDAIRITMLFAGPPEDDIDWADVSPAGPPPAPTSPVSLTTRASHLAE